MKKIIGFILLLVLCVSMTACGLPDNAQGDKTVYLKYVSDSSELIPLLVKGDAEYGVLGEPAATMANAKAGTTSVLDLQAEYKKASGSDSLYTQAGVLVKGNLANDKNFMYELYTALKNNKTWLLENVADVKAKLNACGSALQVNFTEQTIERCNLDSKDSLSIKTDIEKYFTVIKEFDGTFIGGNLPADDFYMECEEPTTTNETTENKGTLTITVPDGAPALTVLSLNGTNIYGYDIVVNVVSKADLVLGALTNGTSDVVVLPTNVCAKLYNKGMKVKLASVNIFGVLYMVSKTEVNSLDDLVGKTIYNIGMGGTPDLTLKYILKTNGYNYQEV
mgnify:CR=1 FL=1